MQTFLAAERTMQLVYRKLDIQIKWALCEFGIHCGKQKRNVLRDEKCSFAL